LIRLSARIHGLENNHVGIYVTLVVAVTKSPMPSA
jgi:hypothetical protein